ncbi:Uncharacterised protein [Bordetella hinzii]|nr:Uncharacterised protein [Bordetella hinzii]
MIANALLVIELPLNSFLRLHIRHDDTANRKDHGDGIFVNDTGIKLHRGLPLFSGKGISHHREEIPGNDGNPRIKNPIILTNGHACLGIHIKRFPIVLVHDLFKFHIHFS